MWPALCMLEMLRLIWCIVWYTCLTISLATQQQLLLKMLKQCFRMFGFFRLLPHVNFRKLILQGQTKIAKLVYIISLIIATWKWQILKFSLNQFNYFSREKLVKAWEWSLFSCLNLYILPKVYGWNSVLAWLITCLLHELVIQ